MRLPVLDRSACGHRGSLPQLGVPAGLTAATVTAVAATLTGLSGLGCERSESTERSGGFLVGWGPPRPLFRPELEGSSCLGAYSPLSGCLESRLGDNTGKAGRASPLIW